MGWADRSGEVLTGLGRPGEPLGPLFQVSWCRNSLVEEGPDPPGPQDGFWKNQQDRGRAVKVAVLRQG